MKKRIISLLIVGFLFGGCGLRHTGKVRVASQDQWSDVEEFKYASMPVATEIRGNIVDSKVLDMVCYPRYNTVSMESDFSGIYSKEKIYFNDARRKEFLDIINKFKEWSEIVGEEKVSLIKEIDDTKVELEYNQYNREQKTAGKVSGDYIVSDGEKFLRLNILRKNGWSYSEFYKFPALIFTEQQVEKLKNNLQLASIEESIQENIEEQKRISEEDKASDPEIKKRAEEIKGKLR